MPTDHRGAECTRGTLATQARRYFEYAIAQYVHSRREERINVGVIVFDDRSGTFRMYADAKVASERVKRLAPEVDRRGLELYVTDLVNDVSHRHGEPTGVGSALERISESWANAIQLTGVRSVPAVSAYAAVEMLAARYLPNSTKLPRELSGLARAQERTRAAISVVFPEEDLRGVSGIRIPREFTVSGRKRRLQDLVFPFFLHQRILVDTLSFDGKQPAEMEREATEFIEKVRWLREQQSEYIPTASVALDPDRLEDGASQIDHILYQTKLDDRAVVEAERANVALEYARELVA